MISENQCVHGHCCSLNISIVKMGYIGDTVSIQTLLMSPTMNITLFLGQNAYKERNNCFSESYLLFILVHGSHDDHRVEL